MRNRLSVTWVVAVMLAAGIAASALAGCASTPAAINQLITPAAYNDQFVSTGAARTLIDVRTAEEFASGHISGAVNIPVDEIGSRLGEVPKDAPVVVYCRSGNRSAQAARILADAGYTPLYDLGGITTWTAQGFPIEQ